MFMKTTHHIIVKAIALVNQFIIMLFINPKESDHVSIDMKTMPHVIKDRN